MSALAGQVAADNQAVFVEMTANADADVKTSADTWSKGIAAILTVAAGGAWIAGPQVANDIEGWARFWILFLAGIGIVLHIACLWILLTVTAGTPRRLSLAAITVNGETVRDYRERKRARRALGVRVARGLGLVGIVAIFLGVAIWLTVPKSGGAITVERDGLPAVCGSIESSDGQTLVLAVPGQAGKEKIPFSIIENMSLSANCG